MKSANVYDTGRNTQRSGVSKGLTVPILQRSGAYCVSPTGVVPKRPVTHHSDLLQLIVCGCTAAGQIRSRWFTETGAGSPRLFSGGCMRRRRRQEYLQQNTTRDLLMKLGHNRSMNTTLTAKLKVHTTPDQFHLLRQTQRAYRDALNHVSRYAFAPAQMSNQVGVHGATYGDIRARCGVPAQMACSVPRQVGATDKALWTKVKANTAARTAGHSKKRYRGLDQPPKYVSPTRTYQRGHDYGEGVSPENSRGGDA